MKPGLEEGGANLYQNLKDRSKSVGQGSHDHFLTVDRRNMIYGGVTLRFWWADASVQIEGNF